METRVPPAFLLGVATTYIFIPIGNRSNKQTIIRQIFLLYTHYTKYEYN